MFCNGLLKIIDDVEWIIMEWVIWFNIVRFYFCFGDVLFDEFEVSYYVDFIMLF